MGETRTRPPPKRPRLVATMAKASAETRCAAALWAGRRQLHPPRPRGMRTASAGSPSTGTCLGPSLAALQRPATPLCVLEPVRSCCPTRTGAQTAPARAEHAAWSGRCRVHISHPQREGSCWNDCVPMLCGRVPPSLRARPLSFRSGLRKQDARHPRGPPGSTLHSQYAFQDHARPGASGGTLLVRRGPSSVKLGPMLVEIRAKFGQYRTKCGRFRPSAILAEFGRLRPHLVDVYLLV